MSILTDASLIITPNAYKAGSLLAVVPSNGNGDLTWTRNSGATRVNSAGLIEVVAANVPRLDYSLGGCPSILLEPQRTNLLLRSEEFENVSWGKTNSSVTANSATSPSGILNADSFTANGILLTHLSAQSLSVTSGTSYAFSVYAKKDTNNFIQLYYAGNQFTVNAYANFDLNNGVLGTVGSAVTASITSVGNGWYRCTIVAPSNATASSGINIGMISSATSPRAEANTLSTSVFLYGAQLEVGAYATSYIPTTSASVTRIQDAFSRNNIFTNGLISSSGGTWFVEIDNNLALVRDASSGGIGINTGTLTTSGNGFTIRNASTPSRFAILKVISDFNTNLFTTTTDKIKVAITWNGTTANVFVNGVKVFTDTAFTATNMENYISGGQNSTQYIKQMWLENVPMTDVQLIAATTL